MTEADVRAAIVAVARAISETGLSPGLSGNVSARWKKGMLITPSALPYDQMTAADIVAIAADGKVANSKQKPSTEWRFHLAALKARPGKHAVVHTHSLNATVLACAGKPIPAFHYMVAVAGGTDIPLVPYALFGTETLAEHVTAGLSERDACLLANHGQIALGATLDSALDLAREVETLAEQYVNVLKIGKPRILNETAMAEVLDQFKGYGRSA
ncbi:MAG: class II aldolase/adducin family protein [Methyloligellaceae bacterium]